MVSVKNLGRAEAEYRRELRAALSRELHDGPIRELTTLVVRLEGFRSLSDDPRMQQGITAIEEHARAALMSLRRISLSLRDVTPEEDIALAIQAMIERYRSSSAVDMTLVVSPAWPTQLPDTTALHLLRIVQEAVSNAVLHAGCHNVLIELEAEGGHLRVSVSDDGRGMDHDVAEGTGLRGMRQRAVLIGGRLVVRRRHPGTAVEVDVDAG